LCEGLAIVTIFFPVRDRIKTVKTVEKITKTMKMIANSRMKAAQNRLETARSWNFDSLFKGWKVDTSKKNLLISFCSDRGLCGALNSSIIRRVLEVLKEREPSGASFSVATFGEKSAQFTAKKKGDIVLFTVGDISKKSPTFIGIGSVIDRAIGGKLENYDSYTFIYNRFNSLISYSAEVVDYPSYDALLKESGDLSLTKYEFEDEARLPQLRDFLEFALATKAYHALAENQTSELSSRVQAMENASKNCKDLIKRLNLMYNRKRQATITNELIEIISGSEAQVSSK
jgi:F-type H+-transporting ATPase subunit gamma